jgi:hypothetical protein
LSIDLFSRLKGQVTQGMATALLENYGYRVSRLGIEEQHSELSLLPWAAYSDLGLPKQLRTLPDLLVTTPDCQRAWMVEVKMRSRITGATLQQLGVVLREQATFWPQTHTILFLAESFQFERGYVQDHLRVIAPDNIDQLVESATGAERKWNALPMLHSVFDLVEAGHFFTRADRIVPAIRALALARDEEENFS